MAFSCQPKNVILSSYSASVKTKVLKPNQITKKPKEKNSSKIDWDYFCVLSATENQISYGREK